MSWQAYVDSNLVGTGKVSRGAIIGAQGGVWAASKGYNLSQAEQNAIIKGLSNPTSVAGTGLHLAGQKYMFVNSPDEHTIIVKKGAGGASIVKTQQAILIGEYGEGVSGGENNVTVAGLADYLRGVGY